MQYHPPSGSSDPNAPYVGKNVATGVIGSKIPPGMPEFTQREIVSAIAFAGMAPTDTDLFQLTRAIRGGQLDFASDTGTADALVATVTLAHNQIKAGLPFVVLKGQAANATATPRLTLQGPGGANPLTQGILKSNGGQVQPGDLPGGAMLALRSDGANFRLLSLLTISDVLALIGSNGVIRYGSSTMPAGNQILATVAPSLSAYAQGYAYLISVPSNVAAGAYLAVNGLAGKPVYAQYGTAIQAGDWNAGETALLVDDGSRFRMVSRANSEIVNLISTNGGVHFGTATVPNASTVTATVSPGIAAYGAGYVYAIAVPSSVGANSYLSVNGLPGKTIQTQAGNPIQTGDWNTNEIAFLVDDGSHFRMLTRVNSDIVALISANGGTHFGQSTMPNATTLNVTVSPSISAYVQGYTYLISAPYNVGTGAYMAVNGLAGKPIRTMGGLPIQSGDWNAGEYQILIDDGTNLRLISRAYSEITAPSNVAIIQQVFRNAIKAASFSNATQTAVPNHGNAALVFADASTADITNNGSGTFTIVTPGLYFMILRGFIDTSVAGSSSNDVSESILINGTLYSIGKLNYYATGNGIWTQNVQASATAYLPAGTTIQAVGSVNVPTGFNNANAYNHVMSFTKLF